MKIGDKFQYGSTIYGVNHKHSDIDFLEMKSEEDIADFYQRLEDHDPVAVEVALRYLIPFEINLAKLRKSFSAKASNSWVKAKKKLEVEHDYYIGKKSLWHSLRLLIFGISIAQSVTKKEELDFAIANFLYDRIVNNPRNDWAYFKAEYQETYNKLRSDFRKVAPL